MPDLPSTYAFRVLTSLGSFIYDIHFCHDLLVRSIDDRLASPIHWFMHTIQSHSEQTISKIYTHVSTVFYGRLLNAQIHMLQTLHMYNTFLWGIPLMIRTWFGFCLNFIKQLWLLIRSHSFVVWSLSLTGKFQRNAPFSIDPQIACIDTYSNVLFPLYDWIVFG